ncbi:MAG: hypothetical protein UFA98_10835 [Ruminococcus sp.]|nr:hypothetical protein [Ruminococcus sp.]
MSKPVSILLVEDDDKLRSTIQDYMQMNGFQVTACPDGVTALRQFRLNGEGFDIILLDGTSAGLDIHLHPKQDMEGGSVTLAQGVGGQKATFPNAMYAWDDVALLASTRQCTRNGVKETKDGFYQYSAAWDSKHIVSLPQGKSAQLLYSMQEMDDGETLL